MSAARSQRQRELARIHCLKKELGLDDDLYRDVLWTVARVRSSAQLDAWGRQAVIEHMQARRGGGREAKPGADRQPLAGKIRAQMDALGVGDAYVDGIARQMFGIERWTWCSPEQMRKLVAGLWYGQRRRKCAVD